MALECSESFHAQLVPDMGSSCCSGVGQTRAVGQGDTFSSPHASRGVSDQDCPRKSSSYCALVSPPSAGPFPKGPHETPALLVSGDRRKGHPPGKTHQGQSALQVKKNVLLALKMFHITNNNASVRKQRDDARPRGQVQLSQAGLEPRPP